jgi:site-specific recombinase XerD
MPAVLPALFSPPSGLPAARLAELDEAAAALGKNAAAPNTVRAYESDWQSWCTFCVRHGFTPLPAAPEHVRLYLAQLVEYGGRKGKRLRPKTTQRHIAAIAAAHRAQNVAFDTKHPALQRALDVNSRAIVALTHFWCRCFSFIRRRR